MTIDAHASDSSCAVLHKQTATLALVCLSFSSDKQNTAQAVCNQPVATFKQAVTYRKQRGLRLISMLLRNTRHLCY
jgi:hypothetical protein